MNHRLSSTEKATLERDGYVLRRSVFDRSEVREIVMACEELVTDLVARRQGERQTFGSYVFDRFDEAETTIKWEGDTDVVHGIEPLAHLSPELERWGLDPRFVEPMIEFVHDDSPVLFTEKLNLKRPKLGGRNPLHQDFPYWDRFADDATRVATAMLFLDDSTMENGTLEVVPGSHTSGRWPTRSDRDDFGNLEIDPERERDVVTVPVEVEAGSVVYFGPFLAHRSAPNRSERERRSLLYSYQPNGFAHERECRRRSRSEEGAPSPS